MFKRMCINRGIAKRILAVSFFGAEKRPQKETSYIHPSREYLEGNFCYQCDILQREAPEMAH